MHQLVKKKIIIIMMHVMYVKIFFRILSQCTEWWKIPKDHDYYCNNGCEILNFIIWHAVRLK